MSCVNNFSLPDMIARKCEQEPEPKKKRGVIVIGHICPEVLTHISSLGFDDVQVVSADQLRINPESFPIRPGPEPLILEVIKRPPEPIFTENKNYLTGRTLPRRKGKR